MDFGETAVTVQQWMRSEFESENFKNFSQFCSIPGKHFVIVKCRREEQSLREVSSWNSLLGYSSGQRMEDESEDELKSFPIIFRN